jgi:hypothetical protein
MKALEFEGQAANHDQIRVPPDVAEQIPEGSVARVIILLDADEDENWRRASLDRFSAPRSLRIQETTILLPRRSLPDRAWRISIWHCRIGAAPA